MDLLKFVEVIRHDWPEVKRAPWSFIRMIIVVGFVVAGVSSLIWGLQLQAANIRAEGYKNERDNAQFALAKAVAQLPKPTGPVGVDGQPLAFVTNEGNAAITMRHNYASGKRLLDNRGRGKVVIEDSILNQR